LAERRDRDALIGLTAQRNPSMPLSDVERVTDRELTSVERDPKYRLFVAELDGKVIGFCRFYDSAGLPPEKKIFPSPEGWYVMGILVEPSLRRRGIAGFLAEHRLTALREAGATEVYSVVDEKNETSLHMHRSFGFEEVAKAEGFLHIRFESGSGRLFRKSIS
jgi:ribosomal protein S18 acetylase RimI-like enzyme